MAMVVALQVAVVITIKKYPTLHEDVNQQRGVVQREMVSATKTEGSKRRRANELTAYQKESSGCD
jgi:hypothetical protein